jgi:hypothetical protein
VAGGHAVSAVTADAAAGVGPAAVPVIVVVVAGGREGGVWGRWGGDKVRGEVWNGVWGQCDVWWV